LCRLLSLRDTARVMSQENVEIARATFDAWNAGDMEALRELYEPDVVLRTAEGWPEQGPHVGRDAVMRHFEQVRGAWDDQALEPIEDFIDVADHVLVRHIYPGGWQRPRVEDGADRRLHDSQRPRFAARVLLEPQGSP
jgi:ketosteroid isomerase-like protein